MAGLAPAPAARSGRHRFPPQPHRVEGEVSWLLERAAEYLWGESACPVVVRTRSDLRRSLRGDDHPDTLDSAYSLAVDLRELGQYEQARQLGEDTLTALPPRPRRRPSPIPYALPIPRRLPCGTLGQYERARQLGEDTLTRCRRTLGDDHPHTLRRVHRSPSYLRELGQYERARQLGEDNLTRMRRYWATTTLTPWNRHTLLAVYLCGVGTV